MKTLFERMSDIARANPRPVEINGIRLGDEVSFPMPHYPRKEARGVVVAWDVQTNRSGHGVGKLLVRLPDRRVVSIIPSRCTKVC